MTMANSPVSPPAPPPLPNKNLYNGGSEWQNDLAGNLPNYQQTLFRNYDAAIGRFVGNDPQPESAESMTTYEYSGNNPIMFNDPLGDVPAGGIHSSRYGFYTRDDGSVIDMNPGDYKPAMPQEGYDGDGGSDFLPDIGGPMPGDDPNYLGDNGSANGDGMEDYSDFWNPYVAAANNYLSSSGSNVWIHQSGNEISSLYNNGGSIANSFAAGDLYGSNYNQNWGGGINSSGSTIGVDNNGYSRTSDNYLTVFYKSAIHGDDGYVGYPGLIIQAIPNYNIDLQNTQWIQFYMRDDGSAKLDQLPGASWPFYYNDYGSLRESNFLGTKFVDFPGFNPSESGTFSAQATLVKLGFYGLSIIDNITYKFSYQANSSTVSNVSVTLNAPTWSSTSQVINNYNTLLNH